VQALTRSSDVIFSICLFCWVPICCGLCLGDGRHFYSKGSCNSIYNLIVYVPAPDPCIPDECCIPLDAPNQWAFFLPKMIGISRRVKKLHRFEFLKVVKAVFFYYFLPKNSAKQCNFKNRDLSHHERYMPVHAHLMITDTSSLEQES